MKVLQIHNRYRHAGGEDAVVSAEAHLLRAAGHEVVDHQVDNPKGAAQAAAALALSAWNPRRRREFRQLAEHHRPHIAHVHNTWYALSPGVLEALRGAGIPIVMTLHNYRLTCANALLFRDGHPCTDCIGSTTWHAVRHRCYRDSAAASAVAAGTIAFHRARETWQREVDVFLALTEFARARFIEAGLPAEKIRVKANFVADDGMRSLPPSASRTLLFAGRLSPEKGADLLLSAWERAAPCDLELLVAGDGPQRAALEQRGVPGVRFLGHLPSREIRRLMRSARALVFPSQWFEGLPVTILEAFSSGLPVLGSDLGSTAELVGAISSRWLIPAADKAAWAQALARLSDDRMLDEMSARVRATYVERYSPPAALLALEQAYEAATGMTRDGGR